MDASTVAIAVYSVGLSLATLYAAYKAWKIGRVVNELLAEQQSLLRMMEVVKDGCKYCRTPGI